MRRNKDLGAVIEGDAVEGQVAVVKRFESGDQAQQTRLAAAVGADDRDAAGGE